MENSILLKNIIAEMFNFNQAEYFEADEGSQNVPEVNFGN